MKDIRYPENFGLEKTADTTWLIEDTAEIWKKYNIYLFDFDGTLADTRRVIAGDVATILNSQESYKLKKITEVEIINLMNNNAKLTTIISEILAQNGYIYDENSPEVEFLRAKHSEMIANGNKEYLQQLQFSERLIENIKNLRNNNKIVGIVSNNDKNNILKWLEANNIDNLFNFVIGYGQFQDCQITADDLKPNTKMIKIALNHIETNLNYSGNSEILYIGDTKTDFQTIQNFNKNSDLKIDLVLVDDFGNQEK
jgi:HAD superfamily hydrolase (TIGR01549 family)